MYRQGVVYIWQNQVGNFVCLNGTECVILNGPFPPCSDVDKEWWWTDTGSPEHPNDPNQGMIAFAGDLREKKPPTGEDTVFSMFRNKDTNLVKHEPNEVFEDEVLYYFRTIWNEPAN